MDDFHCSMNVLSFAGGEHSHSHDHNGDHAHYHSHSDDAHLPSHGHSLKELSIGLSILGEQRLSGHEKPTFF